MRPTAWQKPGTESTGRAAQAADSTAPLRAHEWTPWSGRSPALSSQLEQLQLGQGCAAVGGPVQIGIARTAVALDVSHSPFSFMTESKLEALGACERLPGKNLGSQSTAQDHIST